MKRISIAIDILNFKNLKVSYDLNHEIQSLIYSLLENEYKDLHDEITIKDFTFTNLIFRECKRSNIVELNTSKAYLNISSDDENKISAIIKVLTSDVNKIYYISNIKFTISDIKDIDKSVINNKVKLRTETPICLTAQKEELKYLTNPNKKEFPYISLIYDEDFFIKKLKHNILHKSNLFDDDIKININKKSIKRKSIPYKDGYIVCFHFEFEIEGKSEIIEKSYYAGFGTKNALGFGYVKLLN